MDVYVYGADFDTETYTERLPYIEITSAYDWAELESSLRYEGLLATDSYQIVKKIDRERRKIGDLVVSRAGKQIAVYEVIYNCSDYDKSEEIWNRLENENGSYVAVEKVAIISDSGKYTLQEGDTLQMKAAITPSNASDQKITWSVSDEKYATISSTGLLKGVKEGKVTVYVETNDGSKKASQEVTVTAAGGNEEETEDPPADEETMIIEDSEGELKPQYSLDDDCVALSLKKSDGTYLDEEEYDIAWKTSDITIADFEDGDNRLYLYKAGTVNVSAIVTLDNGTKITSKSYTITIVNENGEETTENEDSYEIQTSFFGMMEEQKKGEI